MLLQVQEDAAHHRQQGFCHCQQVICVVSVRWLWWLVQLLWVACREVGCKVSHNKGCRPTQACPVHSPRLSDVKQIWESYRRVNAPSCRVSYANQPSILPKARTNASTSLRLSNPNWAILSSSDYGKKNPPPACASPSAGLTAGQTGRGKCREHGEGHVCTCSGTGTLAWKHTEVYVKWRQKETRGHTEIKHTRRKCGNVRETGQGGANGQERKREKAFRLTGSTGQETSKLQVCTGTLGIESKHSHTQYHTLK